MLEVDIEELVLLVLIELDVDDVEILLEVELVEILLDVLVVVTFPHVSILT